MNYSQEELLVAKKTIALFHKNPPSLEEVIIQQRTGRGNDLKNEIIALHDVARKETNYPYIFTPLDFCQSVLNKIEEYSKIEGDILVIENIEFVAKLIAGIRNGKYINIGLIHYISFSQKKIRWVENRYDKYGIVYTHKFGYVKDKKGKVLELTFGDIDMKSIDFEFSNPPYSEKKSNKKKEVGVDDLENGGESNGNHVNIWKKIVEGSLKLLKEDGYMAMIHPRGWRDASNTNNLWDIMATRQIEYLNINDEKKGSKTFGNDVTTNFDWYVLQNTPVYKPSIVIDQDDKEHFIDLREWDWLPSGEYDIIKSLIAKNGEEKIEFMYDTSYHHQVGKNKGWLSKEKTSEHIHPCVYYVKNDGGFSLYHSSIKKGHFGVSKVIIGTAQGSGVYCDKEGEYGLCQFSFAIVDSKENLESIKKAIESEKFNKLMEYFRSNRKDYRNRYIISKFRKDWWKSFI